MIWVLWIYIVYGVQNKIINSILCLYQSIAQKRKEIEEPFIKLCERKGMNMLKAEVCPDYVYMSIEILFKIIISIFVMCLKIECDKNNFMSEKYRKRAFYYVDTAAKM